MAVLSTSSPKVKLEYYYASSDEEWENKNGSPEEGNYYIKRGSVKPCIRLYTANDWTDWYYTKEIKEPEPTGFDDCLTLEDMKRKVFGDNK